MVTSKSLPGRPYVWTNDGYDDEDSNIVVRCPRGVDGVMLPNDMDARQYWEYMSERNGEVVTYNIKNEDEEREIDSISADS